MAKKKIAGALFLLAIGFLAFAVIAPDELRSIMKEQSLFGVDMLSVQSGAYTNGEVVLNLIASGSGTYYTGTFSPADIEALVGVRPTGEYRLDVEVVENTCEYAISEEGTDYYTWNKVLSNFVVLTGSAMDNHPSVGESCTPASATQTGGIVTQSTPFTQSWRYWCYAYARGEKVGTSYNIDPTTTYYNKIKVTLTTGGNEYTVILDPNNLEGEAEGIFKTKFLGSLMGQQSCPSMASNYVVWRKPNTAELELKNKFTVENARSICTYMDYYSAPSCTGAVSAIDSDSAARMLSCEVIDWEGEGTTAKIKCEPYSPPALPVLQVTLPASASLDEIVEPEGDPEILGVVSGPAEAADFASVLVSVRNNGESASFDVALDCGRLSPTSKRVYLLSGEEQVVSIPYTGAGVIQECTVEMRDVNHPSTEVTKTAKIDITPFCDRDAPSGNHELAYTTEYGCVWVCPNQHSENIFEGDCAPINYLEKEGATYNTTHTSWNCIKEVAGECKEWEEVTTELTKNDWVETYVELHEGEAHCIAEGKYVSIKKYLEDEYSFIPTERENKVWLAAPYCAYAEAWGYSGGSKIGTGYVFDYGNLPEPGQSMEAGFAQEEPLEADLLASKETPSFERIEATVEGYTGLPCGLVSFLFVLLIVGWWWITRK